MSFLSYIRKNVSWKDLYENLCSEKAHLVHDTIPVTIASWESIQKIEDLRAFLHANPHYGLLCFNHRKQVILFHSLILNEDDDTIIGALGINLEANPIEITFPTEIFRSYQLAPGTKTPSDTHPPSDSNPAALPTTDEVPTSLDPSDPPSLPPFKTAKSFFLVPPAHITHMLDQNTGIFKLSDDLDQWLTEKILNTPPLSTDGFHHFEGFSAYWSAMQVWIQTIVQAPKLPFIYSNPVTDMIDIESFIQHHIPEDIYKSIEKEWTPATAANPSLIPHVAIPPPPTEKPSNLAGSKRDSVGSNDPSSDNEEESSDSPKVNPTIDMAKIFANLAGTLSQPFRQKKKKKSTTNIPPNPPVVNPNSNLLNKVIEVPHDPTKATTADNDSAADPTEQVPDPNANRMAQLLQLMMMQQAQAQADQAKARAEARQLKAEAERNRIEQALILARTQEENARTNRELRESNQEIRDASDRATRELRELIQLQTTQLNSALIQATANRVERESASESAKSSKKLWTKLQASVQTALTRGSATDDNVEPTEPYDTCLQIYNNTDKHTAQTMFMNQMASIKGRYHPGQLANLIWSGPFWEITGEPETLTVFAMHPKSEAFKKHTKAAKMAAIKVDYDHHVDKEEINTLYQQDLNFPTEVHDFLKMLKGFAQVIGILFGPQSILHTLVFDFYLHAFENDDEFTILANLNPHNLSKFLYGLDLAVQNTLLLLGDASVPFGPNLFSSLRTELARMKHDLAHRHAFLISFPQGFTAELRDYLQKLKEKEGEKKGNKLAANQAARNVAGKQKPGQGDQNVQPGRVNSNMNPAWKIPEGIEFKDAFMAPEAKGKSPKHNNIPFCLNYFVLGRCKPLLPPPVIALPPLPTHPHPNPLPSPGNQPLAEDHTLVDSRATTYFLPPTIPNDLPGDLSDRQIQRIHQAMAENTSLLAELNDALLRSHRYDLQQILTNAPFNPCSYGSEFRPPTLLQPLLGKHELWDFVSNLFANGAHIHTNKDNDEDLRHRENAKLIEYNNHIKTSDDPTLLTNTLKEDIDRGFALILSASTIQRIPNAMVCPLGVVSSSTIDEHGNRNSKSRLTHDQSYHFHKTYLSLNQRSDKEAYPGLIYGGTLERFIYAIITLRTHYPNRRILALKTDFSKAYRRIHYDAASAPLCITAADGLAYMSLRLTFGGSVCPHIWCAVSEIITDFANDLIHNSAWSLSTGPRASPELMAHLTTPPDLDPRPFATALPTMLSPPPCPQGYVDVYIDDMICIVLDEADNVQRAAEALLISIDVLSRPIADNEPVRRDPILNVTKLKGEGRPSEQKVILGWQFCLRTLTMRLPTDKYLAYSKDVQALLTNKQCSNKELEQLIGRLSFVSQAIPIARNFLGRLRSKHHPTAPPSIAIHLKGKPIQRILQFWLSLLDRVHNGVNLNLRTLRQPTNIIFTDACPEGIGGFSVTTGKAWRYHISSPGRHHINSVEFLAATVGILMELHHGDVPLYGNILALTDNSSCAAWLHKSNFDQLYSPLQAEVACHLASECIRQEISLNPQHVPGHHNLVADALSRRWDLTDHAFPSFLFDSYPLQTPGNFQIWPLPDAISCWTSSTLALAPPLPPDKRKLQMQAAREHGDDGSHSSIPSISQGTRSSATSNTYSKSNWDEHSYSLSASDHIPPNQHVNFNLPAHVRDRFWDAVSGKPLATWHRNFGTTTGAAPFTTMNAPTSSIQK